MVPVEHPLDCPATASRFFYMSTLSFHADQTLEMRIRAEARQRQVSVSRLLADTVAAALPDRELRGADLFGVIQGSGTIDPEETVLPPWDENLTGTR